MRVLWAAGQVKGSYLPRIDSAVFHHLLIRRNGEHGFLKRSSNSCYRCKCYGYTPELPKVIARALTTYTKGIAQGRVSSKSPKGRPPGGGNDATSSSNTNKENVKPRPSLPSPSPDSPLVNAYYPHEISNAHAEEYMTGVRQKPIITLLSALSVTRPARKRLPIGDCVVHWFRGDLRLTDNTALSLASRAARAAGEGVGLVGLYVLSPQDLEAHVVSPAKLDFALRSLRVLKEDLEREFGVPLWIEVVERRKDVTGRVLELCRRWGAGKLFANMEYEVDELRRDAKIVKDGAGYGVSVEVVHDLCVVPPGDLVTRVFFPPFTVPSFPALVGWLSTNGAN